MPRPRPARLDAARGFLPLALLAVALLAGRAHAEGTTEVGTGSHLQNDTDVYVDILATTETIVWTSANSGTSGNSRQVQVFLPGGGSVGTFNSGATITATTTGAYRLRPVDNQDGAWSVVVNNPVSAGGRVYSRNWHFFTNSFANDTSVLNNSFYALVPGGAPGTSVTVQLQFAGLQGNDFNIVANRVGVDGRNGGRSVPSSGNSFTPQFPLYLNPPTLATNDPITPTITNVTFTAGASNLIIPGQTTGEFRFDTNADGTYHVVVDTNKDGVFNEIADGVSRAGRCRRKNSAFHPRADSRPAPRYRSAFRTDTRPSTSP